MLEDVYVAVKIYFYDGELKSSFGANRLEKFLKISRRSGEEPPGNIAAQSNKENDGPAEKMSGCAAFGSFISYGMSAMTGATRPSMLTAEDEECGGPD